MSFKQLISSRFRGHPCIGSFADPYRNRTVQVHDIDDEQSVGLCDGTDAWIANRTSLRYFQPGKFVGEAPVIRRRVLVQDAAPIERRRVNVAA